MNKALYRSLRFHVAPLLCITYIDNIRHVACDGACLCAFACRETQAGDQSNSKTFLKFQWECLWSKPEERRGKTKLKSTRKAERGEVRRGHRRREGTRKEEIRIGWEGFQILLKNRMILLRKSCCVNHIMLTISFHATTCVEQCGSLICF